MGTRVISPRVVSHDRELSVEIESYKLRSKVISRDQELSVAIDNRELKHAVYETPTSTGRGHFACQDSGVSQIFIPSISNEEKILGNANAVV